MRNYDLRSYFPPHYFDDAQVLNYCGLSIWIKDFYYECIQIFSLLSCTWGEIQYVALFL
jgi:hypothetical protein